MTEPDRLCIDVSRYKEPIFQSNAKACKLKFKQNNYVIQKYL